MSASAARGEPFESFHATFEASDAFVRPVEAVAVLAQAERLADVGAERLSGTRSGHLKGGPLLLTDANRDRGHLRDPADRDTAPLGLSDSEVRAAPLPEGQNDVGPLVQHLPRAQRASSTAVTLPVGGEGPDASPELLGLLGGEGISTSKGGS